METIPMDRRFPIRISRLPLLVGWRRLLRWLCGKPGVAMSDLDRILELFNTSAKLDKILANQEKTMAAIDDLKAALAQLSTDIAAEIAALQAALTGGNDAAIEDAVANMKALSAQLEASVAPKGPTP
jgi:hypothetical protein